MKIVFLVSHLKSGGAERTVSYLSKYLANQEGMEVTIVSMTNEIFYSLDEKVNLVVLNVASGARGFMGRITNAMKRQIETKKYIEANAPDVVFCMMVETAKFLMATRRKKAYKLITSERINPEIITDPKRIELKNKCFAMSDGIVFQTKRAKEFYPNAFQEKSVVIYNAMGNELVYQVPQAVERKTKISAMGRLSDQKDYPTLFKAFAKVLDTHSEYTLEIFGDGPDEQSLKKLAADMGLEEKILFRGAHKDAILQIADSACYVMSSLYEGMPNSLMEAMGAGIPCVSTDCPNGPAELITDGENGLLVDVGDVEGMALAILKMIEDRALAETCSKNARKILETNSVEIIAKQFMEFIVKVANEGKDAV